MGCRSQAAALARAPVKVVDIFCLTVSNPVVLFLALRTRVRVYRDDGERNDVYPAAQPHRQIASRERITMERYRARRWVMTIC